MKHRLYILLLALLTLLTVGCRPELDEPGSGETPKGILILLPERCQSVEDIRLELKDRNMGYILRSNEGQLVNDSTLWVVIDIPVGYYECTVEALVRVSNTYAYPVRAFLTFSVTDAATPIIGDSYAINTSKDFVLAEIFFAGTQTPDGKQYTGDKYFLLVNNSDETLYADGLILMESKFKNSKRFVVTPDKMAQAMAVDALYRVPGDGTRFPVAPGDSFLIADNAIDHRPYNANSFDMSGADVEWYDLSTSATVTDVDNPAVPNMDKIYCYTLSIWVPNNQGITSFALGRLPAGMTDAQYLSTHAYDYTYLNVTQAGTFEMSGNAYLFPNEWIIDAVNLCPHSAYEWLCVHPSLDCGFAYVAETGSDKTRYGKAVHRKADESGRPIDTNNSTNDFTVCSPHYYSY